MPNTRVASPATCDYKNNIYIGRWTEFFAVRDWLQKSVTKQMWPTAITLRKTGKGLLIIAVYQFNKCLQSADMLHWSQYAVMTATQ